MRNIRSTDTKMELMIRSELHKRGFRFRKNVKTLPGKPDIVFPKYKTVVFLDSCFWHMCPLHKTLPKTNIQYWGKKLKANKKRRKFVQGELLKKGWMIQSYWEHEFKNDLEGLINKIERYLIKNQNF